MKRSCVTAFSVAVGIALTFAGCGRTMSQRSESEAPLLRAAAEASDALAGTRIFFAHQSVGENVMEGVAALQEHGPREPLHIINLKQGSTPASGGFFAHAKLGENGDPKGKTDQFVSVLEGGLGNQLDVAFQKYCFVDIDAHTNVDDLFAYYQQGMARIHERFPRLKIVHVTAPLVHVQSGPKALVKRLIGQTPDHYDDNFARERYNTLMRQAYAGREPVFDIAALESSRPGERREAFHFRGRDLYELRAEYTTDDAHLNAAAERRVAAELLAFLQRVAASDGEQLLSSARY